MGTRYTEGDIHNQIQKYIDHNNSLSGKMLSPEDQAVVDDANYSFILIRGDEDIDRYHQRLESINSKLFTIIMKY